MKTIITFKPIQELTNSQVIIYNGFINNECIEYFLKEVERLYIKKLRIIFLRISKIIILISWFIIPCLIYMRI